MRRGNPTPQSDPRSRRERANASRNDLKSLACRLSVTPLLYLTGKEARTSEIDQTELDRLQAAYKAAVDAWVASIVESGPKAIRLQKELIREWEAMPVGDAIEAGIRCMVRAYQSDEPTRMVREAIRRLKARRTNASG